MGKTYVKKDGTVSVYRETTGKPGGRPSRFTDDLQDHAVTHSQIGLSNRQIAEELDIPWGTFSTWTKKFPEFSARLDENRNKMLIDAKKCLKKRLQGFSYTEKKTKKTQIYVQDDEGKDQPMPGKKMVVELTEKYVPPDAQLAMYVLDKRSKHFRRQPEALDAEITGETFNVYVKEIKPPVEKKKVVVKSATKKKKVVKKSDRKKKVKK